MSSASKADLEQQRDVAQNADVLPSPKQGQTRQGREPNKNQPGPPDKGNQGKSDTPNSANQGKQGSGRGRDESLSAPNAPQNGTPKISRAQDQAPVAARNQGGPATQIAPQKNQPIAPAKDKSLIDRLKKSGLDPQKLLDLTTATATGKTRTKRRHQLVLLGFLLFAAIPSALFSAYMIFLASDQFHSTTAFAIRSSNSAPTTELLGMFLDSGGESTTSNSYIINDYLQSQAVVEDLRDNLDLQAIFNREGADWLFRMGSDLPIEDQLSYWRKMVDVSFDSTSGVIYVEVRSFRPEDSVQIANAILERTEKLVNLLSETNRRQIVRFAEESVAKAEARLKAIRKQMLDYREETQEVSPEDIARIALEMIGSLEGEVISKETEKRALLNSLDEDSPRIRLLTEQIIALNEQIAMEKGRLGGGLSTSQTANEGDRRTSISFRIANYSDLALEEEFARELYTTSLAGLEQARMEADSKQLYLATFINPTLSELAQYPHRYLYSLAVFFVLAGGWVVLVLMYYNVRDRT